MLNTEFSFVVECRCLVYYAANLGKGIINGAFQWHFVPSRSFHGMHSVASCRMEAEGINDCRILK